MSDEYQQRPQGQDKEQPREQEEMERLRREREAFEKRIRGDARARAAAASEYGSMSSDASDYGARISEVASQAKDYVSDRVSVVGDKFKELQHADLDELAENAKQYAREKPGQALLISAAVGLLLGLIIRGRR